jgi:hypothetical protein
VGKGERYATTHGLTFSTCGRSYTKSCGGSLKWAALTVHICVGQADVVQGGRGERYATTHVPMLLNMRLCLHTFNFWRFFESSRTHSACLCRTCRTSPRWKGERYVTCCESLGLFYQLATAQLVISHVISRCCITEVSGWLRVQRCLGSSVDCTTVTSRLSGHHCPHTQVTGLARSRTKDLAPIRSERVFRSDDRISARWLSKKIKKWKSFNKSK